MNTGLKIDNFWDKWSDEEKEAVREFVVVACQEAARIALEKFKSALDDSEENVTTDSE